MAIVLGRIARNTLLHSNTRQVDVGGSDSEGLYLDHACTKRMSMLTDTSLASGWCSRSRLFE